MAVAWPICTRPGSSMPQFRKFERCPRGRRLPVRLWPCSPTSCAPACMGRTRQTPTARLLRQERLFGSNALTIQAKIAKQSRRGPTNGATLSSAMCKSFCAKKLPRAVSGHVFQEGFELFEWHLIKTAWASHVSCPMCGKLGA